MLNKINKMVAVVFFSAIGMITAPTLATVSMAYGASFNPFKDIPAIKDLKIPGLDKEKFNLNLPDTSSSGGSTGGSGSGSGDKGGSGGSTGGSGSGGSTGGSGSGSNACKVDNSQKGTHFYCVTPSGGNSHHHCNPAGQENVCKKFK